MSFGGQGSQQDAFQLAKVCGLDNLVQMLERIGISRDQIDAAAHLLTTEDQHEIEDVQITRAVLRNLGLGAVKQVRRRDGRPQVGVYRLACQALLLCCHPNASACLAR